MLGRVRLKIEELGPHAEALTPRTLPGQSEEGRERPLGEPLRGGTALARYFYGRNIGWLE